MEIGNIHSIYWLIAFTLANENAQMPNKMANLSNSLTRLPDVQRGAWVMANQRRNVAEIFEMLIYKMVAADLTMIKTEAGRSTWLGVKT